MKMLKNGKRKNIRIEKRSAVKPRKTIHCGNIRHCGNPG